MRENFFRAIDWRDDRMLLDDLTFRLEHNRSVDWDGGQHFRFYKIKPLVDQYEVFFNRHPHFRPKRVMEIGIYDGGGTAFWFEFLKPDRLIAIDMANRDDSDTFKQWVSDRFLENRVGTFWRTDQADKNALRKLVSVEMAGKLDLVIDDGSHLYAPSKASFEVLFPKFVPGGFYIIEDWAWDHWPEYSKPNHPWAQELRLTQLIIELIEAAGSTNDLIASVEVFPGFVAVERGKKDISPGSDFKLSDFIMRRPSYGVRSSSMSLVGKLRRIRYRLGKWAFRKSPLPK